MIIVAVIYIPYKLGGWDAIFGAAEAKFAASPNPGDGILLDAHDQLQYVTLAFGSALALFLYPHTVTGVLASPRPRTSSSATWPRCRRTASCSA